MPVRLITPLQVTNIAAIVLDIVILESLDAIRQSGSHVLEGLVTRIKDRIPRSQLVERSLASKQVLERAVSILNSREARAITLELSHALQLLVELAALLHSLHGTGHSF